MKLGAREVNHVKAVLDNDKGYIFNFNLSFYCGFTILPTKLRKLRDYIASRVGKLVVVVGIQFLIDTPSTFRFYAKGLT
jgi:hypothetical protein